MSAGAELSGAMTMKNVILNNCGGLKLGEAKGTLGKQTCANLPQSPPPRNKSNKNNQVLDNWPCAHAVRTYTAIQCNGQRHCSTEHAFRRPCSSRHRHCSEEHGLRRLNSSAPAVPQESREAGSAAEPPARCEGRTAQPTRCQPGFSESRLSNWPPTSRPAAWPGCRHQD